MSVDADALPARTKYMHVLLTEDEHRALRLLTADIGVGISDYVRPILFAHVEDELDKRPNLRPLMPRRCQSAPPLSQATPATAGSTTK